MLTVDINVGVDLSVYSIFNVFKFRNEFKINTKKTVKVPMTRNFVQRFVDCMQ